MNVKYTPVISCDIGDIVVEDVLSSHGVKLLTANTVINKYIKEKLIMNKVSSIYVFGQEDEVAIHKEFSKKYNTSVLSVKKVLNDLSSGKEMDYDKLSDTSNSIYNYKDQGMNIVKYLNEIKNIDEYTYKHCVNVSFYGMLIAKWLGLADDKVKVVIQAGLVHDIGKTKIPNRILNKQGRLTNEEFEEMKKHTIYGFSIVNKVSGLDEDIKGAVLMHHERTDGSGYPYGIIGENADIYSKIISIADVYDAMTSDRIYKKKAVPFDAFKMFLTTGISIFDINIVRIFLNNLAPYYVGAKVILSNGQKGEIVYIPPYDIINPVIKIGDIFLNFSHEKELKILSVL